MKREVAKDEITNKTQLLEGFLLCGIIMQETEQSCIDSMRRRIKALMATKGGLLKYIWFI